MSGQTPLAVRMRPISLDEVAGQQHLLRPGSPIVTLADASAKTASSVSMILWGPPGTGKTTLAQAIARSSGRRFVELSAITAGVKDVREVMQEALNQLPEKQRLALVMFAIEKMPQKDVAEILNCSVEAVKWHVFMARKQLRKSLGAHM